MNRILFSIVLLLSIYLANSEKVQNFIHNELPKRSGFYKICFGDHFSWKGQEVNNIFWSDYEHFVQYFRVDDEIIEETLESKKRLSQGYPSKEIIDDAFGHNYYEEFEKQKEHEDQLFVFGKKQADYFDKQIVNLKKFTVDGVENFDRSIFKNKKTFSSLRDATLYFPVNDQRYKLNDTGCKKTTDLPGFFTKRGKQVNLIDL